MSKMTLLALIGLVATGSIGQGGERQPRKGGRLGARDCGGSKSWDTSRVGVFSIVGALHLAKSGIRLRGMAWEITQ